MNDELFAVAGNSVFLIYEQPSPFLALIAAFALHSCERDNGSITDCFTGLELF